MPRRTKQTILLSLAAAVSLLAVDLSSLAYNFKGYYCPQVLVSPLRPDTVYTPAGMGIVTSKAGFRVHPVTGRGDFHNGVDLGAKLNDKVYNLLDGYVTRVGWRGNMGVAVEVYHPYPNTRTIVGHLNAYAVLPGQFVERGRVIGYAGSTGRSTGVHVHYTVIKNDTGDYIEPMQFLLRLPEYVMALKTAQAQAVAQANTAHFKKDQGKSDAGNIKDEDKSDSDKSSSKPEESFSP